jgi:hypothetical protein
MQPCETARKITSCPDAVKTSPDQYTFQESNLIRIICPTMTVAGTNPIRPGQNNPAMEILDPTVRDHVNVVVRRFFEGV